MSSARSDRPAAGSGVSWPRRAWSSLAVRLAVWYVLATLGSFLVAAVVFAMRSRSALERAGAESAAGTLDGYRRALESGGTEALRSLFDCSPGVGRAIRLSDERDTELFGAWSDEESRRTAATLNERGGAGPPSPAWHVARAAVSQKRWLTVAIHDEQSARLWSELRATALGIFGAGLAFAILGATLITRWTLRPVSALAHATERIVQSGDLSLRVESRERSGELAQLTDQFNRMLSKNEQLVKAMRESLDHVAHDLRTPLTRLRAAAELALAEPNDVEREREALAEVLEQSDRILAMLTTLTDIIEAEAGAMRLDKHREELARIAREAVELYDFVSKDAGVRLVTHLTDGVGVCVDRRRLAQVCANVIDNAIKYTPAGGQVEVSVFTAGDHGVFRVADSGIGIAPEDLARVWTRLFRADRSRGERGLGLGLSLVKAVVEAHGGEVAVESKLGQGSVFDVRLPLAPEGPLN
jgi:signal transduction histidine kinase